MINGLTQAALVFDKSRNAQTMAILIKNPLNQHSSEESLGVNQP